MLWLTQSHYSFLQGASSPRELMEQAARLGHQHLGLVDFDGVYGAVQGHLAHGDLKAQASPEDSPRESESLRESESPRESESLRKSRLNLHHGSQLLVETGLWDEFRTPEGRSFRADGEAPVFLQDRLAFLVPHRKAYGKLCSLISHVHKETKHAVPLDFESKWDDFSAVWPHEAVVILPCRGTSQLFSPRQKTLFERWLSHVERWSRRHGGLFYLALTPPSSPLEYNAYENHLTAARLLSLPLLATADVFFHVPERKLLHDTLTCIRRNGTFESERWALFPNAERTLHHPEYYRRYFSRSPVLRRAYEESLALGPRLNFGLDELCYHYPDEFLPPGFTPQSYLEHLVHESSRKRYGGEPPPRVAELLAKELALIATLNFADYFLTVWDIVRFAKERCIVHQGRGSAANSAVCFVLGITAVDPLTSEMVFERFISQERVEPPDIDVDFEHERREEVIQYVYGRYGRHRAAMVANVITFRTRGALRAVGKVLGFDDTEISHLLADLRDRQSLAQPLEQVLEQGATLDEAHPLTDRASENVRALWASLAAQLRGFPRHLGIHSGGFVVSQDPIADICPTEAATMPGRTVIQWNKDDLESLGLFKIDLLALGMLTALRKTFESLKQSGERVPGTLIPLSGLGDIPPECPKTYAMISQAETVGVFQIESRAQMSMLPRIKPRTFYDLVIQVAIVRPGPISSGMASQYVERRRRGPEHVVYPHPKLEAILKRTLGIPIFQEQVMRIAMAVGDFTAGEADSLRRSMGAWKYTGRINAFREKLFAGMTRNGITPEFAEGIYRHIEGFSQYGFPESHSASFAHIAYASCYLKAHYPEHFLTALLNSQPLGFYSPHALIQNARREGLILEAPCLLHSRWDSEVTSRGCVRLGLRLVAGLRQERVSEFLALRTENEDHALRTENEGRASSSTDATVHTRETLLPLLDVFSPPERVALVMSGCLRRIDEQRRNLLWELLARPSALRFDGDGTRFAWRGDDEERWSDMVHDMEFLNTTLGAHPFALVRDEAWPFAAPVEKLVPSERLPTLRSGSRVLVAGLLVIRQSPPTAKGMVFITLEDHTGHINLVIRPQVYAKYRHILIRHSLLCVEGTKQGSGGVNESPLLVTHVHDFQRTPARLAEENFLPASQELWGE